MEAMMSGLQLAVIYGYRRNISVIEVELAAYTEGYKYIKSPTAIYEVLLR